MSQDQADILPVRVDPKYLADQNRIITGALSTKQMTRLKKHVVSMQPEICAKLQFSSGLYGLPRITGVIKHVLEMRCERCLDDVEICLNPKFELLAKSSEDEDSILDTSQEHDFIEYSGKYIEISGLIEDELLIALPLAPKHVDISLCNQDMIVWLAANKGTAKASNPFASIKR